MEKTLNLNKNAKKSKASTRNNTPIANNNDNSINDSDDNNKVNKNNGMPQAVDNNHDNKNPDDGCNTVSKPSKLGTNTEQLLLQLMTRMENFMEKSIENSQIQFKKLEEKLDQLITENHNLKKENNYLKEKINQIENKFDTIEQMELNNDVSFSSASLQTFNIETLSSSNNFVNFVNAALPDSKLSHDDISKIKVIKHENFPAKIICTFKNHADREKIFDSKKVFREKKVYVSEVLTKYRYNILKDVKNLAKVKNFKFVWTKNGQIFLRKEENAPIIKVTSRSDLQNIS